MTINAFLLIVSLVVLMVTDYLDTILNKPRSAKNTLFFASHVLVYIAIIYHLLHPYP
jgi:hypothetical protein